MKRNQRIWWILGLLIVALMTILSGWQKQHITTIQEQEQRIATSVMTPLDNRHHEATLTDATNLYRVCSSRPQRILPTQGSKTERTSNPYCIVRRHIVKPIQFLHDSRRRLETAPFCMPASCHYYVIALRHIIR